MPFIVDYFAGCELSELDGDLFAESYSFEREEIFHLIPNEHSGLFNDADNFTGASGFLNFNYQAKRFRGCEYTVMLVSNEDYSKALFLYVQEENPSGDTHSDILIADFLKEG
jgi:hypothetical protein